MFGRNVLSELRAVAYLYAVEQCAGKRDAAQKMGVSIDTLNKYIEQLEEECGTELLCMVNNCSQLTSRGKKIAGYAVGIERVLQHIYAVASERDELEGEIHLLWNRNIRSSIISSDLWGFLKRHKRLTVLSSSVDKNVDISGYDYDIALVSSLPTGDDWELVYSKNISFGFFATGKYLSKTVYPLDMDDMLENHHMIFKYDTAKWLKHGDEIMEKAKHKSYISDAAFMVKDGVENDIGIGLLPLSFVRYGLVCLDNIPCSTNARAYIVAKKARYRDKGVKLVSEYLKEMLKTT